jgi:phage-related protein
VRRPVRLKEPRLHVRLGHLGVTEAQTVLEHLQSGEEWLRTACHLKPLASISDLIYDADVDKPIVWLAEHCKTPPMGEAARSSVGFLLRKIQRGDRLAMPISRPMPSIGPRVHELRVNDAGRAWRVIYRIDVDAIVLVEWFEKKTQATPRHVIELARRRLAEHDRE